MGAAISFGFFFWGVRRPTVGGRRLQMATICFCGCGRASERNDDRRGRKKGGRDPPRLERPFVPWVSLLFFFQ